jgi:hypothetical protein
MFFFSKKNQYLAAACPWWSLFPALNIRSIKCYVYPKKNLFEKASSRLEQMEHSEKIFAISI